MENFNPFNKDINDISGSDLSILKTVTEGWYVDYKQLSISLDKYAKHISSFANQYGGWLFIGIKESSEMTAGEFSGLPTNEIAKTLVKIRESISKYVNPEVYFETKIINGPVKEINLSENHSIIILGIPQGINPPYIHRSGMIYRRVADQSDPVPETDRFVLDQLWNRGKESKKRLIDFINNLPVLSEAETIPYLNIYFLTNPEFSSIYYNLDFEHFKDLMNSMHEEKISAPLETAYTTTGGFVGRQVAGNEPLLQSLTFRWWSNGNARVVIPINVPTDIGIFNKYHKFYDFYEICKQQGLTTPKFADFNYLLLAIISMAEKFFDIYEYLKIERQIYTAAVLTNTWRIIPFIDSEEYINRIKVNGIPVIQDDMIYLPNFLSKESLIKIDNRKDIATEKFQSGNTIIACLPIIILLLNSIGINLSMNASDNTVDIFKSLFTLKK